MQRTPSGTITSSPTHCWGAKHHGTTILFFSDVFGRNKKSASSLDVCLLMPIKIFAFGVTMHIFFDNFQMTEEFQRRACMVFDAAIKQCYVDVFLCLPTATDIELIVKLHKS